MYDKYPIYDVPRSNVVQRFFAQPLSAILLEIAMTIVITLAAGSAFDFFGPFDGDGDSPAAATESTHTARIRDARYLEIGRYEAAQARSGEAVEVAPDAHARRGYDNLMAGDYTAAQAHYLQALQGSPADVDVHVAMCWAYGEQGHFAPALGHCNIALALARTTFERALALENRCWARVEMGDYAGAASDCAEVLRLLPACDGEVCALAHYNLGRVMLAQGNLPGALGHFEVALFFGSSYPPMYLEIAEVYATLGIEAAASRAEARYHALVGVPRG